MYYLELCNPKIEIYNYISFKNIIYIYIYIYYAYLYRYACTSSVIYVEGAHTCVRVSS